MTDSPKLPPHSEEAECGVLGCILMSSPTAMPECASRFKPGPDVFYDIRRRSIYTAVLQMYEEGKQIDLVTVAQHMKDRNAFDGVGGMAYLSTLCGDLPSTDLLLAYCEIVLDKFMLRKLIRVSADIQGRVHEYEGDLDDLMSDVEKEILGIRASRVSDNHESIKSQCHEAAAIIEMKINNPDSITGISTGLRDLDRRTDGLHKGEMVVIGAYPSTGKTALAFQIGFYHAFQPHKPNVVGFSAETKPAKLIVRADCSDSRVNFNRATLADMPNMIVGLSKVANSNMHLVGCSGWSISQVRAKARQIRQKHGKLELIVVDYAQIISGKGDNREQEVASVSSGCKQMALEEDCPVIVLSQLNDDGKLRESRSLSQDADSVWKLKNQGDWMPDVQPVDVSVDKSRDGETGKVPMVFLKTFTKFESAQKKSPFDN